MANEHAEHNRKAVGDAAMRALDHFGADDAEDFKIGNVMILAEWTAPGEDGEEESGTTYFSTSPSPAMQMGMLMMAALNVWAPKEE